MNCYAFPNLDGHNRTLTLKVLLFTEFVPSQEMLRDFLTDWTCPLN